MIEYSLLKESECYLCGVWSVLGNAKVVLLCKVYADRDYFCVGYIISMYTNCTYIESQYCFGLYLVLNEFRSTCQQCSFQIV